MAGTDELRTAYSSTTIGPNSTYGQAGWTATTRDRTGGTSREYGPRCSFVPVQAATESEALLPVRLTPTSAAVSGALGSG